MISVIISTYNRGQELRDTLASLLQQDAASPAYEVLVVDNNSTDDTRAVIEAFAAGSGGRLRYLFEPRQGVSWGRNTGIAAARGAIIAFTDDDVIVAADWIAQVGAAFAANPDVDYLTGKILPLFEGPRPAWLTDENSGPCTIRDRGDAPIYSERGCFFPGWATANFAIRRAMLDAAGHFDPGFPRGEDLELVIRIWRAGGRGMYAPRVVVSHKIPAERTGKAYHRMWHHREGDIRARVRYKELFDAQGRLVEPPRARWLGAPLFVYRELLTAAVRWLFAAARGDAARAFFHESRVRQAYSYLQTRRRSGAPPVRSGVVEESREVWRRLAGTRPRDIGGNA
jgi:GT2 family glycosyltransferase